MSTTTQPPKLKRRWYQFRRRTLLVLILASAVAVGWTVFEMTRRPACPIKLPAYHGMTRAQVLEGLGDPDGRFDMTLGQIEDELHWGLQKHLDSQIAYKAEETVFLEWRWSDGEYHIALWFREFEGEWIVVESLRWHESIVF